MTDRQRASHGGVRPGAGRPAKYSFLDMMRVGQACEGRFRRAVDDAVEARLAALPHRDEIRALQQAAQAIPVSQRAGWLQGDGYEDHKGDLEAWLHERGGTLVDAETGNFPGAAQRLVRVSDKAPRGTRKRIVREVASDFGLTETATDNLWQAYRRFERKLSNDTET